MKHVISSSYGNDSMALIQLAHELSLDDVTVVYCNTGWAAPGWEDRVELGEALARGYGFNTVQVTSMGMSDLVRHKKGWPSAQSQFCTGFLKGLPFLCWIDDVDLDCKSVVLIGKRRAESPARANTPEFIHASEYHGGRKVWHPLYLHSDEDRNSLLIRAGIEILDRRSDECSPCANANRKDLRALGPSDIAKVRALEAETGQPMFRAEQHGGARGIDQVIHWAKYSPGQYKPGQDDLFDAGCGSPFGCGL